MYPYYKKDLEEGKITPEEALELIELLRIKIYEFNSIGGGKAQRENGPVWPDGTTL
jgi:formate C-acetyltransferase